VRIRSIGVVVFAILAISQVQLLSAGVASTELNSLTTCTKFTNEHQRIPRSDNCRDSHEFTSRWHVQNSDTQINSAEQARILICSNKPSSIVRYKIIRAKCAKHQIATTFIRQAVLPEPPIIETATAISHDSVSLILRLPKSPNLDAPIAFYTITPSTGLPQKIYNWQGSKLVINTLSSLTTYSFTISATSVDGTSANSQSSATVSTLAYSAPKSSGNNGPGLAAPAFTLSSGAETATVNTGAVGFTVSSTGGSISSFTISALPAGMSFDSSTGTFSGTPTSISAATNYTVVGTNSSGTASQVFKFRVVNAIYTIGQIGPGGGKIFYESSTAFACGPTLNLLCNYLEVAPEDWAASGSPEVTVAWSGNTNTSVPGGTLVEIGTGYKNTLSIIAQNSTAGRAATVAQAYRGGGFSDWFLPSNNELESVRQASLLAAFSGDFTGNYYWSSSELSATSATARDFGDASYDNESKIRSDGYRARPVRGF